LGAKNKPNGLNKIDSNYRVKTLISILTYLYCRGGDRMVV